jgi:WD40 repeat protein
MAPGSTETTPDGSGQSVLGQPPIRPLARLEEAAPTSVEGITSLPVSAAADDDDGSCAPAEPLLAVHYQLRGFGMRMWRPEEGSQPVSTVKAEPYAHWQSRARCAAYTLPDGTAQLAVSGKDGKVEIYDGRTLQKVRALPTEGNRNPQSTCVYQTADHRPRLGVLLGTHILLPEVWPPPLYPDPCVVIFDLESGDEVTSLTADGGGHTIGNCLAVLPTGPGEGGGEGEGPLLAMGASDGGVHVWDLEAVSYVAWLSCFPKRPPSDPLADPNDRSTWPAEPLAPEVRSVAWYRTADGQARVVAGYADGGVRLYELAGRSLVVAVLQPGRGAVEAVAWCCGTSGDRVVSAHHDGTTRTVQVRQMTTTVVVMVVMMMLMTIDDANARPTTGDTPRALWSKAATQW